jgi:hypothetical protein
MQQNLASLRAKGTLPPDRSLTRRQVLALAGVTFTGIALGGCSGGSLAKNPGGDFSLADRLVVNPQVNTIADERGVSTAFLGFLSAQSGSLASFWGTQDAQGVPLRLTQSLFWDSDPINGVRVLYDGQGLPTRVEHEENGAFVLLFWDRSDAATLKFYQPDGTYIGGATVTGGTSGFTVAQLSDSQVVGYYSGRINGLTDAIVTFTVGGTVNTTTDTTAARGQGRGRADTDNNDSLTGEEATQAKKVVAALATQVVAIQTGFAGDLLKAIAEPLLATGKSELGTRILTTALQNTGVSPLFLGEGLPILQGLATPFLLRTLAEQVNQQATEQTTVPSSLGVAYVSPDPVTYKAGNIFKTTRPTGDSTSIRGIVAAREFDTVPVSGVIDASGNVYLSGTAINGAVIELRGQIVNGTVSSGQWQLKSAPARAENDDGTWNADETPLGQCTETANSGGQGIFTNTYDLGKCGTFSFFYDAYSIPDQFQIYQDENIIFDTGGKVSGGSTVSVTAVGQTTLIRVVVTADNSGTAWEYNVGCPE